MYLLQVRKLRLQQSILPSSGGICIPLAVLGTVLGGILMRRLNLSVKGASKLCTTVVVLSLFVATPLLLIGCSTQRVVGVFPPR